MDPPGKTEQRRRLRALLRAMDPAQLALHSARISAALRAWPALHGREVAMFSALPDEPDLSSLPGTLNARGIHYPLVVGPELSFHAVRSPAAMRAGAFGIREPDARQYPLTAITEIDVFL
jgi:5-formyltetrahydrofolate cyclo-ligase